MRLPKTALAAGAAALVVGGGALAVTQPWESAQGPDHSEAKNIAQSIVSARLAGDATGACKHHAQDERARCERIAGMAPEVTVETPPSAVQAVTLHSAEGAAQEAEATAVTVTYSLAQQPEAAEVVVLQDAEGQWQVTDTKALTEEERNKPLADVLDGWEAR